MHKRVLTIGLLCTIGCGDESFRGDSITNEPQEVKAEDATPKSKTVAQKQSVEVPTGSGAPACKIVANKDTLHPGTNQSAKLTLTVQGKVATVTFDGEKAPLTGGEFTIAPAATKTYVAKVAGDGKSAECEATINVVPLEITSSIRIERFASTTKVGKLTFRYTLENLAAFEKVKSSSFTRHTGDIALDAAVVSSTKKALNDEGTRFSQTFELTGYYKSTGELVAYQDQLQRVTLSDDKGNTYAQTFAWIIFTYPQGQTPPSSLSNVPQDRIFTGTAGSPGALPTGPIVKQ